MSGHHRVRKQSLWRLLTAGLTFGLFGGLWFAWSADLQPDPVADEQPLRPVPTGQPAALPPSSPALPGTPPDSLSASDLQKLDRVQLPARPVHVPGTTTGDAQIRLLIERMLPESTTEEREIWVEELQGMPLGVAEDLLRFRQQLGPETSPDAPLWSPETSGTGAKVTADSGEIPVDVQTVQQLRAICRQNLLLQHTPGYLRVEPVLAAAQLPGSPETAGLTLTCLGQRLDLRPSGERMTGRPLDVLISPDRDQATGIVPFFAVETSSGPAYTRCGRLEIDEQRRLAIRGAEGLCPLVPAVILPPDCPAVKILWNGHVVRVALTEPDRKSGEQTEDSSLGQIQLATFPDASQLKYDQHGWLRATDGSGPAALVETWLLRPGHLETSNVEVKDEQAQLRWVEELALQARSVVPTAGERLMEPGPLADDRESATGLP